MTASAREARDGNLTSAALAAVAMATTAVDAALLNVEHAVGKAGQNKQARRMGVNGVASAHSLALPAVLRATVCPLVRAEAKERSGQMSAVTQTFSELLARTFATLSRWYWTVRDMPSYVV